MSQPVHPPSWAFTAYGLALVTVNLILAVADVGRSFDVLREAAWLYSGLIFSTSAAAAYIKRPRRHEEPEMDPERESE